MFSSFKKITKDRSGNVGLLFAALIMPSLALVGLAVDFNRAYQAEGRLKVITDGAAIAGARLPATANDNRINAAKAMFEANVKNTIFSDVVPKVTADNGAVVVQAKYSSETTLLGLLGLDKIDIKTRTSARAQIENGGVVCMLALNPSTGDGLHLQGVNKWSSNNCWTWVNSTASSSINGSGNSTGKAQGFCTAGGVVGAEHFAPSPWQGCSPLDDPFRATFAAYSPSTVCTHNNVRFKNNETVTLSPGVYCGGIELKPGANITFLPGVYVIKDGKFEVTAQSTAVGDRVTFYFTGNDSRLDVQGGGNIQFRAPNEGPTAGFVFVQNPTSNPGADVDIRGGGSVTLEGAVYTPTWRLNIGGNGDINLGSRFFTMVADSFYLEGNGKLYVRSDAAAAGLPNIMPRIPSGPLLLQ